MICIDQGYLVSHAVSTKFAIVIVRLSPHLIISNHTITGPTIVETSELVLYYFLYHTWCREILYEQKAYSTVLINKVNLAIYRIV